MRCVLAAGCVIAAIALVVLLQALSLSTSTLVPASTPRPSLTHITTPAALLVPHATRSNQP